MTHFVISVLVAGLAVLAGAYGLHVRRERRRRARWEASRAEMLRSRAIRWPRRY